MKHESIAFQEIFGASTVRESLGALTAYAKPEPQLPTDSDLWEFLEVPTGKAVQQIQDEEFIKAVSGCDCVFGTGTTQPATSAGLSTSEPTELLELMKGSSTALSLKKIKKIINDRLDARLYKHELREKWNAMLAQFAAEGADALPDAVLFRKASAFLGV